MCYNPPCYDLRNDCLGRPRFPLGLRGLPFPGLRRGYCHFLRRMRQAGRGFALSLRALIMMQDIGEWAAAVSAECWLRDFAERPFVEDERKAAKAAPEFQKDDIVFGVVLDAFTAIHIAGGAPLPPEVLDDIADYYGGDSGLDGLPGAWKTDKKGATGKAGTARALAKENPEAVIASVAIRRDPKGGYVGCVAFRVWDKKKLVHFRPLSYVGGLRRVCQAKTERKIIVRHWAGFAVDALKHEGFDIRGWPALDADAKAVMQSVRDMAGVKKINRKSARKRA